MWKRLWIRTAAGLVLTTLTVLLFHYFAYPLVELPSAHEAALRMHVAAHLWNNSELLVRRIPEGLSVTLTSRGADGRVVRYRYEVSDTLVVTEVGISLAYPPPNAMNLLLALILGLLLFGFAVATWVVRRLN